MKYFIFFLSFVTLIFSNILYSQVSNPETDLYYFVVDKSGSIEENGLTDKIKTEINEYIAELPNETKVSIVLFDDKAYPAGNWSLLKKSSRNDIAKYMKQNYIPSGNTRLYDTVADVINSIRASKVQYRMIEVIIMSDGIDNRSKNNTWKEIEALANKLLSLNPKSFFSLYTLGYTPKSVPQGPSFTNINVRSVGPIKLKKPPRASFIINPSSSKIKESVLFADNSLGNITNWLWELGNQKKYTKKTFEHAFTAPGNYNIKLTVVGPDGIDIATSVVTVLSITPLKADFSWSPILPIINKPIRLIDESIGSPANYVWKGSEIGIIKVKNPTVKFLKPGEKNITLIIAKKNKTNSITKTINVTPEPPVANFDLPEKALVGEEINIKAKLNKPAWKHSWTSNGSTIDEKKAEIIWVPLNPGLIEIIHTVEGLGGVSQEKQSILIIENYAPEIIKPVKNVVQINQPIEFECSVTGDVKSIVWKFGKNGKANGKKVTYTFSDSDYGKIDVKLTCYFDGIPPITVSKTIEVVEFPSPVITRPKEKIRNAFIGETVTFTMKPRGTYDKIYWVIDGIRKNGGFVASHTFTSSGEKLAFAIAEGIGGVATNQVTVNVRKRAIFVSTENCQIKPLTTSKVKIKFKNIFNSKQLSQSITFYILPDDLTGTPDIYIYFKNDDVLDTPWIPLTIKGLSKSKHSNYWFLSPSSTSITFSVNMTKQGCPTPSKLIWAKGGSKIIDLSLYVTSAAPFSVNNLTADKILLEGKCSISWSFVWWRFIISLIIIYIILKLISFILTSSKPLVRELDIETRKPTTKFKRMKVIRYDGVVIATIKIKSTIIPFVNKRILKTKNIDDDLTLYVASKAVKSGETETLKRNTKIKLDDGINVIKAWQIK